MDLIVQDAEHRYWWAQADVAQPSRPATPDAPFTCLLWDAVGTWPASARGALLNALLAAGCRYFVCGGSTCERWHDDADENLSALAAAQPDASIPHVGTTWHTGEPLEDVAEFFVLHAWPLDEVVTEHLVIQIGPEWDIHNDLIVWVRAWVQHPYGVDAS